MTPSLFDSCHLSPLLCGPQSPLRSPQSGADVCTWSADLVMEKIFRMGEERGEVCAWF